MPFKTAILSPIFAMTLTATPAFAEPFQAKCPDIPTCSKYVGETLNQKYLFDKDVTGTINSSGNVDINRDNAELLFTQMLWTNGFTRVPVNAPDTYVIMRQRDARDAAIPVFKADEDSEPRLPNTWDIVTMIYKVKNPDAVEPIARNLRSFMPAASRIIPNELSGQLFVTDSIPNMKKVYALIKETDRKPTAEMKKLWEKHEAERKEEHRFHALQMPPGQGQPGAPQAHPDPKDKD